MPNSTIHRHQPRNEVVLNCRLETHANHLMTITSMADSGTFNTLLPLISSSITYWPPCVPLGRKSGLRSHQGPATSLQVAKRHMDSWPLRLSRMKAIVTGTGQVHSSLSKQTNCRQSQDGLEMIPLTCSKSIHMIPKATIVKYS